jgi:hypothetical protein
MTRDGCCSDQIWRLSGFVAAHQAQQARINLRRTLLELMGIIGAMRSIATFTILRPRLNLT